MIAFGNGMAGLVPGYVMIIVLVALLLGTIGSIWRHQVVRACLFAGLMFLCINWAIGTLAYRTLASFDTTQGWPYLPHWAFYAPVWIGLGLLVLAGVLNVLHVSQYALEYRTFRSFRRLGLDTDDAVMTTMSTGHARTVVPSNRQFGQSAGEMITAPGDQYGQRIPGGIASENISGSHQGE